MTAVPVGSASGVRAQPRVLYVQGPGRPRTGLGARFERLGYGAAIAATASEALRLLADGFFSLCLVDLTEPVTLTTVRLLRARWPELPVAGVVDPGSPVVATEAIHAGLADLLTWPFDDLEVEALVAEVADRAPAPARAAATDGLVAISPAMRDVLRQVDEVVRTRQSALIVGAHGTGKALVARSLHRAWAGDAAPFIVSDCRARTAAALVADLFGREAAVRQGAARAEIVSPESAVARARGGTLLMAHLDEAPARVQLRVAAMLRDREVLVDAGSTPAPLNVRVAGTVTSGTADGDCRALLQPELDEAPDVSHRRSSVASPSRGCADAGRTVAGAALG